jgi:hypothetical protein
MTTPSTDAKPKTAPKKRRRGKGEGTIYKHESSGLWTAQVTIGENAAGKPIKRTVYGKKRDDVKIKLQLLQEKMRRGTLEKPSSITLEQNIAHWLENDIKCKIGDGTYHKYESNARVHIYPEIGGTEVQKLTRPLLSEFISKKEEKKSIYVFPAKDGSPINPNSFRRTFKRLIKEAGLDESIRFHDMRHNYASQLVALNVHQTLIQAQMRHSDAKSTSIYSPYQYGWPTLCSTNFR